MTRIAITPSTVRTGAARCDDVAREASGAAGRIGGLPAPEGLPAGAASALHEAAAQLRRSAASARSESAVLRARAGRAAFLDGPFGVDLDMTLPPLRSPWALPPGLGKLKGKQHHGWFVDALDAYKRFSDRVDQETYNFERGVRDEALAGAKGTLTLAEGLAAHAIDGDLDPRVRALRALGVPIPRDLSSHIGPLRRAKEQIDRGVGLYYHHPGKALAETGKGMVDLQDLEDGKIATWAGHIAFMGATLPRKLVSTPGEVVRATREASRLKEASFDAAERTLKATEQRDLAHRRLAAEGVSDARPQGALRRRVAPNLLHDQAARADEAAEKALREFDAADRRELNARLDLLHARREAVKVYRGYAKDTTKGAVRGTVTSYDDKHDK